MIAESKKSAVDYWNLAVKKRAERDVTGAIRELTEAIQLQPETVAFYTARGTCLEEIGQIEKAIEDFSEAIRLKPGEYGNYLDRGGCLRNLKDTSGAIADFSLAIALNPQCAYGYLWRGKVHESSGYEEDASEDP